MSPGLKSAFGIKSGRTEKITIANTLSYTRAPLGTVRRA